jgi:hypothetical protein
MDDPLAPMELASPAILAAFANNPAQVLGQDEQMQRVGGRGDESEVLVEGARRVVLRMGGERADADDVGHPHRPAHGVLEQAGPNPPALPGRADRKSRQHFLSRMKAKREFGLGVVYDMTKTGAY